jgi:hypothetical protein
MKVTIFKGEINSWYNDFAAHLLGAYVPATVISIINYIG